MRASMPAPTRSTTTSASPIHRRPSTSTIWRILKRRGFIQAQPHKRPKSSFVRFEAQLPNETWQSDVTFFVGRARRSAAALKGSVQRVDAQRMDHYPADLGGVTSKARPKSGAIVRSTSRRWHLG